MANLHLSRRQFISNMASMAVLADASFAAIPAQPLRSADRVVLGRAGIVASRQGLGVGDGKAEAYQKMGQKGFDRLIRHALERGVCYFDLLPGPAHSMIAAALKGVPRERYLLVTNFRHPEEQDPAKMIDRYLRELRTDYLDAVLVGAIMSRDWAADPKWALRRDLLSEAKLQGKVRAQGVSVHGWDALESVARDEWIQLALLSCNHRGSWMDGPPDKSSTERERRDAAVEVIKRIHAAGIGTAGMKIFSHSGYRDAPAPSAERRAAIEFVMALGVIDTMPIQCESIPEFDEVQQLIDSAGRSPAGG